MKSICFPLKIKKDKVEEYINIHKKGNVWNEVLENLKVSKINKLKIYMLDNIAILYMEGPDPEKSLEVLGEQETQIKWNEETAPFMDTQPDYGSDEIVKSLRCVFDFEDGIQK